MSLIHKIYSSYVYEQEKDVRELKDESDNEENEGVEAEVDMMLHGGVSLHAFFFLYIFQHCQFHYKIS